MTSQTAHTKYKWPPYATDRNPPENFLRTPLIHFVSELSSELPVAFLRSPASSQSFRWSYQSVDYVHCWCCYLASLFVSLIRYDCVIFSISHCMTCLKPAANGHQTIKWHSTAHSTIFLFCRHSIWEYRSLSQTSWATDPHLWIYFFLRPQSDVASIHLLNRRGRIIQNENEWHWISITNHWWLFVTMKILYSVRIGPFLPYIHGRHVQSSRTPVVCKRLLFVSFHWSFHQSNTHGVDAAGLRLYLFLFRYDCFHFSIFHCMASAWVRNCWLKLNVKVVCGSFPPRLTGIT